MSARIDTIVFDIGWVLVTLDYEPLLGCLRRAGISPTSLHREVFDRAGLEAHESGRMDGEGLIGNIAALGQGMDRAEVRRHWMTMFAPVEPMFDLARRLSRTHRVHLLSNVGDLHWQQLVSDYGIDRLGHGALPSFEAGVMKPHAEIYRIAERRFGFDAARAVFIDDLEPNVNAARACGWQAIRHESPERTMAALRELGVE